MTVIQARDRPAAPAQGESASAPAKLNTSAAQGEEGQYREAIQPIHRRIRKSGPFYLSAVQSGSHDVYAAIDQTFASLEASIGAVKVPTSEVFQHQLLLQATQAARQGLAPAFTGDRLAHAQRLWCCSTARWPRPSSSPSRDKSVKGLTPSQIYAVSQTPPTTIASSAAAVIIARYARGPWMPRTHRSDRRGEDRHRGHRATPNAPM